MNANSKHQNIEHLTEALDELRLCHHQLGEAIQKLSLEINTYHRSVPTKVSPSRKNTRRREVKVTKEDCEGLIGSQVRIVNPGKGESDLGYIHSVGKVFITIVISGGVRKQRIAKNLHLLKDE